MPLTVRQERDQIEVAAEALRVVWAREAAGWRERVYAGGPDGALLTAASYHLKVHWPHGREEAALLDDLELVAHDGASARLRGRAVVAGVGELLVGYEVRADGLVRASVQFDVTTDAQPQAGLSCLHYGRPGEFARLRLYSLMPSGWSGPAGGVTFSSDFVEGYGGEQFALSPLPAAPAQARRLGSALRGQEARDRASPDGSAVAGKRGQDARDTGAAEPVQGVALLHPPAYLHARTRLLPGGRIAGSLQLFVNPDDAWGPDIEVAPGESYDPPARIAPPRISWTSYLANWRRFMERPELWVDLGDGMGLYHRGFYHLLRPRGRQAVSGVLRYVRTPDGRAAGGWTEYNRLIELAWGGVANVAVAETLWRMATAGLWPQAAERARQMVHAVLHFRDGGFQVPAGPCRGAWWNGYVVEEDRFCSRYGRAHVETPNQGIVNYYLYRLHAAGATDDPAVAERIVHNCRTYLSAVERPGGGVDFARYTDGRAGESRGFEAYPEPYAAGNAMAALSWLVAHRLTGEEQFAQRARRLFDFLCGQVERNDWRFLEYETMGADSVAPAWILVALCEALADWPEPRYRAAADRTFELLWRMMRHVDPDADRYHAKEAVWGGSMRVRGGIVHSSTAGGAWAGGTGAHIRYDYPVAFHRYWTCSEDPRAYAALVGYLNFQTWHQMLRPDLPIGYGATTEGCTLDAEHIQDTAQIKHSNPLTMLDLLDQPQVAGTNFRLRALVRPAAGQMTLRLRPAGPGPGWISIDRPAEVRLGRRVLADGPATRLLVPAEGRIELHVRALAGPGQS